MSTLRQTLWIIACVIPSLFGMGFETYGPPSLQEQRPPTEHVLTFFIRPCFCSRDCIEKNDLMESSKDPNFINTNLINACIKSLKNQGVYVVYYGMTTHSDSHGLVTFPRKHPQNTVTLVVTNKPTPIIGQGVTVNRFTVDTDTPSAWYTYSEETINNQSVWNVKKIEIPQNRILPIDAVVIMADPDEIIIHEGASSTVESGSLILPPVYTKKSINLDKDALLFLNINRYFSPVKKVVNYSQDRYARMVLP